MAASTSRVRRAYRGQQSATKLLRRPVVVAYADARLRGRLGVSQAQCAALLGAARKAVVYQCESRKRCPSPVFWARIEALISGDAGGPLSNDRRVTPCVARSVGVFEHPPMTIAAAIQNAPVHLMSVLPSTGGISPAIRLYGANAKNVPRGAVRFGTRRCVYVSADAGQITC